MVVAEFHAEGAGVGDINGDEVVDIAYGPFWFAGPDFGEKKRFAKGEAFDGGSGYSDNFFSFIRDFNDDGAGDILVFGFPGKEARLYLNSGSDALWEMHVIADQVANESPHLIDLIPGGQPEIVCARDRTYGYYEAESDVMSPWKWNPISAAGDAITPFGHGLGVGDVNGDGSLDIVEKMNWYEQPTGAKSDAWKRHKWALLPYGQGGAQILIDDVDADGDNDLITSLNAHGYGIAWFEQHEFGKFTRHEIMGASSTDEPHGVVFSQPHAMALADMDGDGRNDFVTGKRYFAHQGGDSGGLQEPVLCWFRNTVGEDGIEFVPQLVDDDSGVGVEVKVADLNGDGRLDIVTSSKKGLIIHRQAGGDEPDVAERWRHPGGRPQDGYGSGFTPAEALAKMEVPDGFFVDLIAAEPEVTQPVAMCFDARGRIWVIEGHTYPERAPEGEGKDRIIIFEDADGDGSFEVRKVFAEGLNLASGLEIGFGGVFVGAAPYLHFYADADGDDRADGEPEVLLDGWGLQDTHETLNSFTWGPDGWLYGCQGVFTRSRVGKPGATDDQRQPIDGGVWRYHPVSRGFEVFAHGTSNPWGVDFNEYGDCFISACVIPHFYHLSQGGLYERQAGQHYNPWAFDDIKTIADHAHYAGNIRDHAFWGDNSVIRPAAKSDTSALGGGHAHCGLALYLADKFPAQYRGDPFFHNLHGHRIVREQLERNGSGYIARHRPDFLFANDHHFIGVGIMLGPDGALYFSDWVDPQTCHHRDVEIWDRSNGRIYRVRYGDVETTRLDLPDRNDPELVAELGNANAFQARQAQRILQERAAAGNLDREATAAALVRFLDENVDDVPLRLRALWTRHVTGLLTEDMVASALRDPSEHLRGWAVQLAKPTSGTIPIFEEMAKTEPSLVVRRYLASKLQQVPVEQRWTLAENLVGHRRSAHDVNIPLLAWYGIEPLVEVDPQRAFALAGKTGWTQLKGFISRRGAVTPEGREAVLSDLAAAENADEFLARSQDFLGALAELPRLERASGWEEAKHRGQELAKTNEAVLDPLGRLGARFGDAAFFPHWRRVIRDPKQDAADRIGAIQLLGAGGDPELGAIAREMLVNPEVRPAAIAALREFPGPETAEALVGQLDEFPLAERNQAINLLAARPEMALVLLRAVDEKRLSSSVISPVMLDQFARFEDDEITAILEKNWARGLGGVELAELAAAIEEWKRKLNPDVLAEADASRGRQVYAMTCGTCHQLFGEGVALGPDLTGSNRADLGYLLENVLAPSAVLGKDYMLNIFSMKDGATLGGMIRKETPESVLLAMPGGTEVEVKVSEVVSRQEVPQSLMPPGLFDALPIEQVADLVKYLGSSSQVEGEAKPPTEPGVSQGASD
ncbi:MAG: PVC-type heme-binding CxxCH protein [Thermomicrobiales bacterium]